MGWLEWGIDPRSTGDSCSLASQGLQAVLDVAFSTPEPSRKKVCEQGIARDHFPHGLREQDMGARPEFMENSKCLDSIFRSARYNAGYGKRRGVLSRQSVGLPF